MAPTAPTMSARQKRLARANGSLHPLAPHKVHRPEAQVPDGFLSNKKDKRLMKHSAFVSRIQKVQPGAGRKRRRPSKKLVATLESLADALPELDPATDGNVEQLREGRTRHKSLKSKPGALRRKEKIVKGEMERFGVSLARLTGIPEQQVPAQGPTQTQKQKRAPSRGGEKSRERSKRMQLEKGDETMQQAESAEPQEATETRSTASRWAALRGYIASTMEQNPAFTGKG